MTAESCPTPHPPSHHFANPNLFSKDVNVCYIERIPSHTLSKCCMDISISEHHVYISFFFYNNFVLITKDRFMNSFLKLIKHDPDALYVHAPALASYPGSAGEEPGYEARAGAHL